MGDITAAAGQPGVSAPPRVSGPPAPVSSGWRYTFSSLAVRDYRLLWLGTLFMVSGFQMQMIAQGYLVYTLTGSAQILGVVSAGAAVPMLGLSLVGGAIADRVERKRLIQLAQAGSTLLALFVALAITMDILVWQHLLVAALLQGIIWSFNAPARQALIPQLVGRERVGNAIALISAGMSVAALVAPALAGLIYAVAGPEAVYYTVVIVGVLSVSSTTAIHKTARVARTATTRMTADIKAGLVHIWDNQIVRSLLLVGLAFMLLAAPLHFLLPVLIIDVYKRETEALGLLVSMIGVGALTGTLFVASLRERRRGLVLLGAGAGSGIGLVLVASVTVYPIAVGIMVIIGLGSAGVWSLLQVLIMGRVDDEFRGRVMSVFMMNFGLMPLAVIPAGLMVDLLGPRFVIGLLGAALIVIAGLVLVTQRSLRELP